MSDLANTSAVGKATPTYIDVVSELVDSPVDIVSVGPDREQTILVNRG